jgi:DNA-binding GntR family transcriptional regulator
MRVQRQAPPVRAQVSVILRQAIADSTFMPGQRLVERELTGMLGVSRTSIREALRELAAEGLVRSIPNKGMVVAGLTPSEVANLYELRSALEGLAAHLFVERASDEQVERLRAAYERISAGVEAGHDVLEAKDEFYAVLFAGAENEELRAVVEGLHTRVRRMRAISLAQPGRSAQTLKEILAIVEAVERRDADAAAAACSRHVELAGKTALQASERTGVI